MSANADSEPRAGSRHDALEAVIHHFLASRMNDGQTRDAAMCGLGKWILLGTAPAEEIRSELESMTARLDLQALGARPLLVSLDLVQPEDVEWIVENWLPAGKTILFSGDPKIGKSQVSLSFIAACSRGRPWPDENGVPTRLCSSIILSAEDGIADTIVPRLRALDADLSKIKVIPAVRAPVGNRPDLIEQSFSAQEHLPLLEMAIDELGDVGIVLLDPITAYGGSTNTNVNHEVRRILDRLQALAAKHRIAILLVSHLNKNSGSKALYRSIGSLAYTAVCRMLLTLAKDPRNPARRLLLREGNLLPAQMPGLAFTTTSHEGTNVSKLAWESGSVNMTPDEALREEEDADRRESALDFAIGWLRDRLSDGPVETNVVLAEAEAADISEKTLERARKELGVTAKRRGSTWFMQLPGEDDAPQDPQEPAPTGDHDGVGGLGGVDGDGGNHQEKKKEKEEVKGNQKKEGRQERQGRQRRHPGEPGDLAGGEGEDHQGRQDRQGRQGDPSGAPDIDEPPRDPRAEPSRTEFFEEPRDCYHDETGAKSDG